MLITLHKAGIKVTALAILVYTMVIPTKLAADELKSSTKISKTTTIVVSFQPRKNLDGAPMVLTEKEQKRTLSALRQRLREKKLTDSTVKSLDKNKLIIKIPGTGQERQNEIRKIIEQGGRLELKEVHRDDELAFQVLKEGKLCPIGYKLYLLPNLDQDGKKIGERPILLNKRTIVDGSSIENALTTMRPDMILIRLDKKGGQRVNDATTKMVKGQDRIAVVLDGRCLIAPVVQANLSRDFNIVGLDGRKEAENIVKALKNPLLTPLKIESYKISPATAESK